MEASKCPKCGEEPSYVEHMEKWYCYECNTYVDDEVEHVDHHADAEEHVEEPVKAEAIAPAVEDNVAEPEDFKSYSDDDEAEIAPEVEVKEAEPVREAVQAPVKPEPAVVEMMPAAQPEAAAKAEQGIRMCPACGQPLKWIEKYQRHYCYGCKKYAAKEDKPKEEPKAAPAAEMKTCPDCHGALKYVEKYSEWYCYKCKKYPLRRKKPEEQKPAVSAPETAKGVKACPKCGKPLKYVEKYQRDYCYECKTYAPKETKTCPVCSEAMKFVPQYNEWYCYKCKKYSLRPSKPILLL
jgi:ssDNA-binding Zn-finger/Zn-ribbon topoisomerase 1